MTKISNTSNITGSYNSVIQNCTIENLNITNEIIASEEFEKRINIILSNNHNPLIFFIITTNKEQISKIDGFDNNWANEINNQYGEKLENWCPFDNEEDIITILKEYHNKVKVDMNIFLFDFGSSYPSEIFINRLKNYRKKVILIIDSFGLFTKGNYKLAKKFNIPEVGGCLILRPNYYSKTIKEFLDIKNINVFNTLNSYVKKYNQYMNIEEQKGYVQIDLHISDKNSFFRKITQIIKLHFHINNISVSRGFNFDQNVPLNFYNK